MFGRGTHTKHKCLGVKSAIAMYPALANDWLTLFKVANGSVSSLLGLEATPITTLLSESIF